MADETIAIIPKNAKEELRVILATFKGRDFVDLRVFAEYGVTAGVKYPTKGGVAIGYDKLDAVIAGLQRAREAAITKGLMEAT